MTPVKAPINFQDKGNEVANLQDILFLLINKGVLLANEDSAYREELTQKLGDERKGKNYGETTQKLVGLFQDSHSLPLAGNIDSTTADLLNRLLKQINLQDQILPQTFRIVAGTLRRESSLPLQGIRVQAFHQTSSGSIRLGEDITDVEGRYTIRYESLPERLAIRLIVSALDDNGRVLITSAVIENANSIENINLNLFELALPLKQQIIEGYVLLENGIPAKKLKLRLYRRDFGGKTTLLSTVSTSDSGHYRFSYDMGKTVVSLEIRTIKNDGSEILLSDPINNLSAEPNLHLNLIAPNSLQPLAPEYRRLADALKPHVGGDLSQLIKAKEDKEQQDITILNRATGWDARLIALAAITERLAADPQIGLSPEELYSLARVGLPTEKLLLAQVEPDTVEKALDKARTSGIVSFDDEKIVEIKKKFVQFSDQAQPLIINAKLDTFLPGAQSTYKTLLQNSGLPKEAQEKFATVYFKHQGKPEDLWEDARKEGLSDQQINTLKLQGKLAYLTGNSAQLIKHFISPQNNNSGDLNIKISNPVELVNHGFYDTSMWHSTILRISEINNPNNLSKPDREKLEKIIPDLYPGETIDIRLNEYTEDLARKIRLNYPTQVLSHRIQHDIKFKTLADKGATDLLDKATLSGFQLGKISVSKFLKKEKQKLQGAMTDAEFEKSTKQLQGLQRLYQLTPDDESMLVLKELGINSAFDVMAYPEEDFRQIFEQKYTDYNQKSDKLDIASVIYKKADQITSVTSSMLMSIKVYNSSVSINAVFGTPEKHSEDKENLRNALKDYPTLESLFGSMDFCECEHCRSVLSPAAYLVDLLQFIDAGDTEYGIWSVFLNKWREKYNKEYLEDWKEKADGSPRSAQERKPYDALIERRPDLPHIALTCENTHTALPYIDLVNEILEYYVANDKLEEATANDTGDATTAELLAEPQNIISIAYAKLSTARYPLNLPFDLWLETVRQFCNYFETPLHTILETFRTQDDLFAPTATFDRATLFMESLGLSPAEVALFTNPQLLDTWYELYGFNSANEALTKPTNPETGQRIDLHSAKALARRLGITYKELAEIVKAEFVNSNKELKLHDSDTECNFDQTILQYTDDTPVDSTALLRINLLVRLWRKLGWTIEETDRALSVFTQAIPSDGTAADPNKPPLQTALIYLAHLKTLDETLKLGKQSRIKLLTLWTNMTTTGKKSLYAQLFLNRSILKNFPIFDHPLGKYLTDDKIKLKDHMLALQGALGLTVTEITHILEDATLTLEDAPLLLTNVSILYRYGLLAKALKLSVDDLITLKQLSGLDPFKTLDTHALTTIDQDYPFSQTLEFVKVAEEIKDSGLKIKDIDYWLRHRYDETGKYPPPENTLVLLKSLAEGIRKIEAEHMMPDKSDVMSEDLLRKKLSLALTPDVVDTLINMANTTIAFTVIKKDVDSTNKLNPDTFGLENRISLSYKEAPYNEQKLTIRGVLINDNDLKALVDKFFTTIPAPNATQQQIFTDLLNDAKEKAKSSEFFNNYLKNNMLREDSETGFLQNDDFNKLFSPLTTLKEILPTDTLIIKNTKQQENEQIEKSNQEELQNRRNQIAIAFLPFLRQRLIRQFIVETLIVQMGADPALVESFITDKRLIKTSASQTLLSTFAAIADRQLTEIFKKPITANCSGYLEVPATGTYRFYLALNPGDTTFELHFRHLPNTVFLTGTAGANPVTLGNGEKEYLELKAGTLYHFEVVVKNGNNGSAKLLVQGETLPKDLLSQLPLYSADAMEAAEQAMLLLNKALQIVQHFGLGEREIRYLLTHPNDFGGISFSELPTKRADDTSAASTKRFEWLYRLTAYARLKHDLVNDTDDLIRIFESNPLAITSSQAQLDRLALTAKLTRRDETLVKGCARELKIDANALVNEKALWRLWKALKIIERFGVMPASLTSWLEIVSSKVWLDSTEQDAENDSRFTISKNVKETIKSRFEPETWQRIAQPIFNKLRQRQRDALVSYLLNKLHLERMEQLYEYFLIDPGMEPVVQTSRIRLAISSVQLFIQRSLLNLEPKVKPSVINSKRWEWMKRYRAWEANRKIFLFPENWLEPEFRDNKTHLFSELEGALLQGDVSNDLVEDAFFKYLQHFEELARLDICAMHEEDNGTLHIFGRTFNMPRKYFYRRRYANKAWTPWEPVSVQIEGDHLAPVVWRDRLYLFWVTFLEKPQQKNETKKFKASEEITIEPVKIDVEAHLHWSEYMNGEWSTPEAPDPKSPSKITFIELYKFHPDDIFIQVSKETNSRDEDNGVYIHLNSPVKHTIIKSCQSNKDKADQSESAEYIICQEKFHDTLENSFYIQNKHSTPATQSIKKTQTIPFTIRTTKNKGYYVDTLCIEKGYVDSGLKVILHGIPNNHHKILSCNNIIENNITAKTTSMKQSIFYSSNNHIFFIEPKIIEETIDKWKRWGANIITTDNIPKNLELLDGSLVIPQTPELELIPKIINHDSLINQKTNTDWLINPKTLLAFKSTVIDDFGNSPIIKNHNNLVNEENLDIDHINPQVSIVRSRLQDGDSLASSDSQVSRSSLNIIGGSGLNTTSLINLLNISRIR